MKTFVVAAKVEVEAASEAEAEELVMNMECVDPVADEVIQSPYVEIVEVKELNG